jgi:hypothetical protein
MLNMADTAAFDAREPQTVVKLSNDMIQCIICFEESPQSAFVNPCSFMHEEKACNVNKYLLKHIYLT